VPEYVALCLPSPNTVHLPEGWHREHEWMSLSEAACGPPPARGLTSPNPVTASPQAHEGTSRPPSLIPAKALEKRRMASGGKPAPIHKPPRSASRPPDRKQSPEFTRWIKG
jgi:hypothetical protein